MTKLTSSTRSFLTGGMQLAFAAAAFAAVIAQGAAADGARDPSTFQSTDVLNVADPSLYTGAAWLVRSKNGFRGRVMTQVDEAGSAYTVWMVLFNNPAECATTPCSEMDLFTPGVRAAVFYGNGAISSSDGTGGGVINIDFSTTAGGIPDGWFRLDDLDPNLTWNQNGLDRGNGFKAELHLVVDYHPDPAKDGTESWIKDLTTTNFPGGGPATNHRFAIFLP
jgi:hypothetical protein